ncbi:hypothetical protein ACQCWA_19425 [Rossellomorea aquimaris]
MNVLEAWENGKETREKQDTVIALFINNIRNVVDMEALDGMEKELSTGDK